MHFATFCVVEQSDSSQTFSFFLLVLFHLIDFKRVYICQAMMTFVLSSKNTEVWISNIALMSHQTIT